MHLLEQKSANVDFHVATGRRVKLVDSAWALSSYTSLVSLRGVSLNGTYPLYE